MLDRSFRVVGLGELETTLEKLQGKGEGPAGRIRRILKWFLLFKVKNNGSEGGPVDNWQNGKGLLETLNAPKLLLRILYKEIEVVVVAAGNTPRKRRKNGDSLREA